MKEQTELFEHREAYIKHWKSVEEDHHLIRSSEKKRFNGFLICMVKDVNETLNEKRDGSTTSAGQTIEELENDIDVLMQLLGHHSALALAAPSPPAPRKSPSNETFTLAEPIRGIKRRRRSASTSSASSTSSTFSSSKKNALGHTFFDSESFEPTGIVRLLNSTQK